MKTSFLILTILATSALTTFQTTADTSAVSSPVLLATGDNYFPFSDTNMPDGGWSSSIVKAVFKSLDLPVELDVLPWPRAYKWSKELKYDGSFPYVYSEKRAKDFYYSAPVNQIQAKLFVMDTSPIQSLADIGGKRFCLPKGFSFNPGPEHPLYHYKLIRTQAEGALGCLQQVHKGWSDVGFINRFYTNHIIKRHFKFPHKIRILAPVVSSVPLYLIVSKQHPQGQQLIERFNQGLKNITLSGEQQKIEASTLQWLNHPED